MVWLRRVFEYPQHIFNVVDEAIDLYLLLFAVAIAAKHNWSLPILKENTAARLDGENIEVVEMNASGHQMFIKL